MLTHAIVWQRHKYKKKPDILINVDVVSCMLKERNKILTMF